MGFSLLSAVEFFSDNTVLVSEGNSSKKFAVLQSVGMTNRQLRSMLVYEGLFYAFGAAAAALLLSVILNPLAGNLLESMFWFFGGNFTIVPVLAAIPVFALLGRLIPTVMYGQSAKHSIVERLRDAEQHIGRINDRFVVAANSFVSQKMIEYNNHNIDDWRSGERYSVAYNALRENRNHFSFELARDILSGKYGFMCQYERNKGADTVWSVIYDIKYKKIFRAEGNPSRKKFVEDTRMKFIQ